MYGFEYHTTKPRISVFSYCQRPSVQLQAHLCCWRLQLGPVPNMTDQIIFQASLFSGKIHMVISPEYNSKHDRFGY